MNIKIYEDNQMKQTMKVKFWGVRGSIPSPGETTGKYGGNTPCVSIRLGQEKTLILDAGTGIRNLGRELESGQSDIFIIVTHIHWDHIQGFPFFSPLFQKDRVIYVFPHQRGETMFNSLFVQMDGAHFPVTMDHIPSKCHLVTDDITVFMRRHGFYITRIANNHPGGANGFRIENNGRTVIYITDNELYPPGGGKNIDGFIEFCRGSDVLIHDAQYTAADMPFKHGWGHSLVEHAVDLAVAAGVKHLVLFHHDPDRTDVQLDLIQEETSGKLRERGSDMRCTVAFEGLQLDL
jgi:phosphoribosyl 1,2-cyclic phosphodiesterase